MKYIIMCLVLGLFLTLSYTPVKAENCEFVVSKYLENGWMKIKSNANTAFVQIEKKIMDMQGKWSKGQFVILY